MGNSGVGFFSPCSAGHRTGARLLYSTLRTIFYPLTEPDGCQTVVVVVVNNHGQPLKACESSPCRHVFWLVWPVAASSDAFALPTATRTPTRASYLPFVQSNAPPPRPYTHKRSGKIKPSMASTRRVTLGFWRDGFCRLR